MKLLLQFTGQYKLLALAAFLLFGSLSLMGQTTVTGTVTDGGTGTPLPGVNVVAGTKGAITDFDGKYEISVPADITSIVFSSLGFATKTIDFTGQTTLDVALEPQTEALEDVVVVGYGTVKKSDLTGSVSSIDGEAIKEIPVTSVDQAIQARAPGVQVTQTSAAPGGGVSVRIRGSNSINSGSEPLYVVDGFPIYPDNGAYGAGGNRQSANVMASINPNDIESIEVLKDASATSIYGSRGSNGVVLITTKRGKAGKSKISYEGSYSSQTMSNPIEVLNGAEYATYLNILEQSQGGAPIYSQEQINSFGEGTDWLEEVTRSGYIQNHQITFSGGSENNKYALTGNYHDNAGIIKKTSFKRYGIRLNLDNSAFNKFLDVRSSWSYNRTESNNAPTDRGGPGGTIITALGLDPTAPVYNEDGTYALASYDGRFLINPLQELEFATDMDITNRVLGNTTFTFNITDHLKAKTSIGADILTVNRTSFFPVGNTRIGRDNSGELTLANRNSANILNENLITYTNEFKGGHFVDAVVGYTYQREVNKFFSSTTRGITAASVDQATLQGGPDILSPFSSRREWLLESVLGRVNYNYDSRYLLTLTFRRDGSSRFGAQNKWANFPSVALGWNIANESFFENSGIATTMNKLKLRGSWGLTGNSEIPVYNSLANLNEYNYVIGGSLVLGLADGRLSNSDLKWETTTMRNIGLDASFFNNRLNLTLDYFNNKTEDLLLFVSIPSSLGFQSILKNSGSLENKGFEVGLDGYIVNNDNFKWNLAGNLSILRNRLTSLGDSTPFFSSTTSGHLGVEGSWVEAGNPIGVWRGYDYIGIFQSAEEIANNPSRSGDQPGYPRYRDVNGDGEITPDDYTIIGDPNPDFTWGLNSTFTYKNFDMSIFFRGSQGFDVRNLQASELGDGVQKINQIASILTDSWTPQNTDATRPIIDGNRDFANSYRDSDYFIEDGSFIRLQNVSLGYTLPSFSELITRARVYVSGQNLLTITDYSGFDPEVNNRGQNNLNRGDDYDAYPRSRTLTVGVNLEF
ncbi:SusC/RagA family TonB-linked outer membrane protein [Leeuwenhoekiella sp. UBA6783]|uniref:SusC/RagA family TonB-linked outer membrane protein n=1 Tax=Leeuwenhoekiella sp. UBA6783 TaxID=1946747 RepID=UPI0025B880FE|nr:TonB-dependent receptor [Leeuwenhoekiella sp. UBA6783]|tara:strand:+ start:13426 stop:16521 length:3096 start_codon:yes stop_codon:yes gene_type:complete